MDHVVSAEIVGSVASVAISPGDRVGPEDAVVVLESMKMEIPVLAERAGSVVEVVVSPGDVVREGDPLAVIRQE